MSPLTEQDKENVRLMCEHPAAKPFVVLASHRIGWDAPGAFRRRRPDGGSTRWSIALEEVTWRSPSTKAGFVRLPDRDRHSKAGRAVSGCTCRTPDRGGRSCTGGRLKDAGHGGADLYPPGSVGREAAPDRRGGGVGEIRDIRLALARASVPRSPNGHPRTSRPRWLAPVRPGCSLAEAGPAGRRLV